MVGRIAVGCQPADWGAQKVGGGVGLTGRAWSSPIEHDIRPSGARTSCPHWDRGRPVRAAGILPAVEVVRSAAGRTPGKMPDGRAGCPRSQCGRDVRAPEGRRRILVWSRAGPVQRVGELPAFQGASAGSRVTTGQAPTCELVCGRTSSMNCRIAAIWPGDRCSDQDS